MIFFSSKNQKWHTPPALIERIKEVYPIDLDLAASGPNVCKRYYDETTDGLKSAWSGSHMWLNPVYGRGIALWARRVKGFIDWKRETGNGGNLLILVKLAGDTQWWEDMTAGNPVICTIKGRLKFGSVEYWAEQGSKPRPAPFPSALIYHGEHNTKLFDLFDELGQIWINPESTKQWVSNTMDFSQ